MENFFDSLFTSAAPLLLASTGALLTELAGVLGIFIEGFMSLGAFFAWVIAGKTGSVFLGTAAAAVMMALAGWALARFVRKTGANPFIASLAVNIAAGSISDSLSMFWFGTKGVLRNPALSAISHLRLPGIDSVPFLGPLLSNHLPSVYLSWFAILAAGLYITCTPWGLRHRAAGIAPEAARERGIRPGRYWEASWAAAALLAAAAGAVLCFRVGAYTPGGVAGRGWISLAAVYLGFRSAAGVFAASLIFAAAEQLAQNLQGLGGFSATVLLGLPNALALFLYCCSMGIKTKRKPQ